MRRASICWIGVVALLVSGCVSRGDFESIQAQLDECRQDKVAAQGAASACEERYEREVGQWENMEAVMSEVLPQTLEEFRREKQEIIELVPEQAKAEVEAYLEELTRAVGQGFQQLQEDNQRVLSELGEAKQKLEEVGAQARSIDETVSQRLERAYASRDRMRSAVAEVVAEIQSFDQSYINDKSSEERLKLNRRERETITLFHDRLVSELTELQKEPSQGAPSVEGG
jgi:hypothetical protein